MRILRLIAFSVLLLIFFNFSLASATEDKLVAIVNNEIITDTDVKGFLNVLFLQLSSQLEGEQLKAEMKKAEEEAVSRLVEDRLILQEAKKKGLTIDNREIEQRLKAIKDNFPSETEFDLYLTMQKLVLGDVKNKIQEQIMMRSIVESEVRDKVFVHPQEVTDYYNTHQQELKQPERIELDSIFIRDDSKEQSADFKIQDILKKLKEGQNFAKLREEFSNSEPIGIVKKGMLNEEIEKVVYNLKLGEVSTPVKTNNGIYLFKLMKKIPESELGLEEIRDKIYQMLFEQKFTEKLTFWVDGLKEKAYILIK